MPKKTQPTFTTDREITGLKPQAERYTASDSNSHGLFIDVKPTGVKTWWYRYTLNRKQERLTIGRYPDLSLKDARAIRDDAANKVAKGISPKTEKQRQAQGLSNQLLFKDYGERYFNEVVLKDRKNPYNIRLSLDNDIYPALGHKPIADITLDDIRAVIWRKKDQNYDAAANAVRGLLKRMFDYAVTLGLVPYNMVNSIPSRHVSKSKPRDRYLSTNEIRTFYTTLLNSRVYRARKLGLLLSLLTMLRKSELLSAKWEHIDFDAKEWLIPNPKADSKTGNSREMMVYLSTHVIAILQELKQIAGDEPYVFVGRQRGTHISHNAFNTAQKTALALTNLPAFTIHDLRRTASTHLNEKGYNPDAIEKCLNHSAGGVRAVYNKAEYSQERRDIMQAWSDFIFTVIYDSNIVFFNEHRKQLNQGTG